MEPIEKEPQVGLPTDQESTPERFGRGVKIHAVFMRHGEKGGKGELTETGKEQASQVGTSLEEKDAIKAYSSPVQRVLDTVNNVIDSAPHDQKLKTRVRTNLGLPPFSKAMNEEWKNHEKNSEDEAVQWYLNFGDKKPDAETTSPHELAGQMAYLLMKYMRMSEKLYSGSNVDLINGTHGIHPMVLLKEILIRKRDDDKEVLGFEKISEIGGAIKFAEGVEFLITADANGQKELKVKLRGETYGVDMAKLNELAEFYEEKKKNEINL